MSVIATFRTDAWKLTLFGPTQLPWRIPWGVTCIKVLVRDGKMLRSQSWILDIDPNP